MARRSFKTKAHDDSEQLAAQAERERAQDEAVAEMNRQAEERERSRFARPEPATEAKLGLRGE